MIIHLLLIGEMPTPAELRASGIKTGPSGGKRKEKASPLLEAMEKFRKAGVEGGERAELSALSGADTTSSWVVAWQLSPKSCWKKLKRANTSTSASYHRPRSRAGQ